MINTKIAGSNLKIYKKLISFIILIVFTAVSLTSCRKNSDAGRDNGITKKIPRYFYKRMEGRVNGKYDIVMNITGKDTALSGDLFFTDKGIPYFFSFGSVIDSVNNIKIAAASGGSAVTTGGILSVKLRGRFINSREIKGILKTDNNAEDYNLHLRETYTQNAFSFIMKRAGRVIGNRESGGASIEYIFPQFAGNKTRKAQAVNKKIFNSIVNEYDIGEKKNKFDNIDSEMSDFVEKFDSYRKSPVFPSGYKPYWENSFYTRVVFNSNNIAVFENTDFRFEGGAHPNTFYNFYNFDMNNGKEISLRDIFKKDFKSELDKIGEKRFKEKYDIKPGESLESKGYFLMHHKFHLSENFAVFEKGLLFKFNPYEIAPYVYGAPEVFIPYSDLKGLLRTVSPISKFLRQDYGRK